MTNESEELLKANDFPLDPESNMDVDKTIPASDAISAASIKPVFRRPAAQPKMPPKNPFASRPPLLRNVST